MASNLHTPGHAPDLVDLLLDRALAARDRPFAIAGLQGSGKSTLAAQMAEAAAARGLRAVVLSIDDFYLDRPARRALGRDVHPLLATRGPPGTHDVALAVATIDALIAGDAVRLPKFDKIGDVRLPASDGPRVEGCDLVIVEGWCLNVPAEAPDALATPVNAVERQEDAHGVWRTYCNAALARDYPALWSRLPRLLFLQPPGFDVVPDWRWQQECTLQADHPDRVAMSRTQVDRFVQLFERVSRRALATLPAIAGTVIRLDAQREPFAQDVHALRLAAHGVAA